MVAGDTKRIVVIKNISSNLIEEVILILKNGADDKKSNTQDTLSDSRQTLGSVPENSGRNKASIKNDFLLKEAEGIISQYIRENRLTRQPNKHRAAGGRFFRFRLSVNNVINIFMIAAILFLLLVITKFA